MITQRCAPQLASPYRLALLRVATQRNDCNYMDMCPYQGSIGIGRLLEL